MAREGVIKLKGKLTIDNISLIKKIILEKVSQFENLTLDLQNAETMDISFFQLAVSTCRSLSKNERIFKLVNLSEEMRTMIHEMGEFCISHCVFKEGEACRIIENLGSKKIEE